MKRHLFIILFTFLFMLAACVQVPAQDRYPSPQTVGWDAAPGVDGYVVFVSIYGDDAEVEVAEVVVLEQLIDLEALGLYGEAETIVRSYIDRDTPFGIVRDYSDPISSFIAGDTADGRAFSIYRYEPVLPPLMIRIQ